MPSHTPPPHRSSTRTLAHSVSSNSVPTDWFPCSALPAEGLRGPPTCGQLWPAPDGGGLVIRQVPRTPSFLGNQNLWRGPGNLYFTTSLGESDLLQHLGTTVSSLLSHLLQTAPAQALPQTLPVCAEPGLTSTLLLLSSQQCHSSELLPPVNGEVQRDSQWEGHVQALSWAPALSLLVPPLDSTPGPPEFTMGAVSEGPWVGGLLNLSHRLPRRD